MKYLITLVISTLLLTSCAQDNDDNILLEDNTALIGTYAYIDYACVADYYNCTSTLKFKTKDSLAITFAKNIVNVSGDAAYTTKGDTITLDFGKDTPKDIIFIRINADELVLQKDNTTWVKNDNDEFIYKIPDCGKGDSKTDCTLSTCELKNDNAVTLIMNAKDSTSAITSTYSVKNDTIITVNKQEGLDDTIVFYYNKRLQQLRREKDNSNWEKIK